MKWKDAAEFLRRMNLTEELHRLQYPSNNIVCIYDISRKNVLRRKTTPETAFDFRKRFIGGRFRVLLKFLFQLLDPCLDTLFRFIGLIFDIYGKS